MGNSFLTTKSENIVRFGSYLVPKEWESKGFPRGCFGLVGYNIFTQETGFLPGGEFAENDFKAFKEFFMKGYEMRLFSNISPKIPDRDELQTQCSIGFRNYNEKMKALQSLVLEKLKVNICHSKKSPEQVLKKLIGKESKYEKLCIDLTQQIAAFGNAKDFCEKRCEYSKIKKYSLKDYFLYGLMTPGDYSYLDKNFSYLFAIWEFTPEEICHEINGLFEPIDFMSEGNQLILNDLISSRLDNKKDILKSIFFYFTKPYDDVDYAGQSDKIDCVLQTNPELYPILFGKGYFDISIVNAKLMLDDIKSFTTSGIDELYELQVETFRQLSNNVWNHRESSNKITGEVVVGPNSKQTLLYPESSFDDVSSPYCPDTRYYAISLETKDKLKKFIQQQESYVIYDKTMSVIGFLSFENQNKGIDKREKHINRFWVSSFFRSWHKSYNIYGIPELALSCYLRMQDSKDILFSVDLPPNHERAIRWAKRMGFLSTGNEIDGFIRYKGRLANTFMV